MSKLLLCLLAVGAFWAAYGDEIGGQVSASPSFDSAKTFFQTNLGYDQRIGIVADCAIIHSGHGKPWGELYDTWAAKGWLAGRMFFANSDGFNEYWTGKWDGQEHPDEREHDGNGNVILCGNRPYMLPTEGWIRYLEHQATISIDAGASVIMPEEPLAHCHSGYEKSFHPLWQQRYGTEWQPTHVSAETWYQTSRLKSELYFNLEQRLLTLTKRKAAEQGREVSFVIPIHSIFSNVSSGLVAPLGTSLAMAADGYVGQIWTGPIRWSLVNYDSPRKSFFQSAYTLYDYFCQLTAASDKQLWLLVDPIEDDVNHSWEDFRQWYKESVAAMLLMSEIDRYEVMPWPDRIFLPGYVSGPGGRSPEEFRKTVLAVTQMLQEIPAGGQWLGDEGKSTIEMTAGIGVAVADTLMWQRHECQKLQGMFGMLFPLLERGVPVSSCVMERCNQPMYMKRFSVIVLSYDSFKPIGEWMHRSLADWVRQGGVLVVLRSEADGLDRTESMWWRQQGFESAMAHLLKVLERPGEQTSWPLGGGRVMTADVSPREFADPAKAEQVYLPLVTEALKQSKTAEPFACPGYYCMQRGPFIIAHAESQELTVHRRMVDVFDPELGIVENVVLQPGESGIYRDIEETVKGRGENPVVLHATHRLMAETYGSDDRLEVIVRGPAQTPGVVRILTSGKHIAAVTAINNENNEIPCRFVEENDTARIDFDNCPDSVTVQIQFAK